LTHTQTSMNKLLQHFSTPLLIICLDFLIEGIYIDSLRGAIFLTVFLLITQYLVKLILSAINFPIKSWWFFLFICLIDAILILIATYFFNDIGVIGFYGVIIFSFLLNLLKRVTIFLINKW